MGDFLTFKANSLVINADALSVISLVDFVFSSPSEDSGVFCAALGLSCLFQGSPSRPLAGQSIS